MNNRDRILAICNRHNLIPQATVALAEEIIAIIKEDGSRPNLRPYQQKAIDNLMESFKEPELIQGYTAENWQEIIDGGYLCEFADQAGEWYGGKNSIKSVGEDEVESLGGAEYMNCRPAQIKGVMRPIFVEPVDKDAWCVFFYDDANGTEGAAHHTYNNFFSGGLTISNTEATKYIEL